MTEQSSPSRLVALAAIPARIASRVRPNLAAAIAEDERFYAGSRRWLFISLLVLAIAYPVAVSIWRGFLIVDAPAGWNTELDSALFPLFYRVYAESLPFMLAMFAVGILSPTLAVLGLTVFLPIDIVASAFAIVPGAQLIPPELAIPARVLSIAVLWIGIIEIPLAVRRWVARRQKGTSAARPRWTGAVAFAVGTGLLTYLWANAMPWLIQPVHSWTVQGGSGGMVPLEMIFPGFYFAWILVLGVGALAFVAAMVRGAEPALAVDDAPGTGLGRGLAGEMATVVVVGFLVSGLFFRPDTVVPGDWDLLQAVLIVGSLVVAGPVMTRLLPRLPAPGLLVNAPTTARWAAALIVTSVGPYVAVNLVPVGALSDYVLIAILFAVVAPVFRYVVDAGPRPAPAQGPNAAAAIVTATLAIALWIAVPMAVSANDGGEQGTPQGYNGPLGALLGGAAAGAGAALKGGWGPYTQKPKTPPLTPFGQPKPTPPPKDDGFRWWNPFTWFN